MGDLSDSRANNIYSSGCDKLTEVQLYISASCQPGSQFKSLFHFLISVKATTQKKKCSSTSEKGLATGHITFTDTAPGNSHFATEKAGNLS